MVLRSGFCAGPWQAGQQTYLRLYLEHRRNTALSTWRVPKRDGSGLYRSLLHLPIPYLGRKSLSTPRSLGLRDDPFSANNSDNIPISPKKQGCGVCEYEKEVTERFLSFPSGDVPYFPLGPNSNFFGEWLVTGGAGLPLGTVKNAPGRGYGWPSITR